MVAAVPLGTGDAVVQTGAHLCAFVNGVDGRDELLSAYVHAGRTEGDKCLCLWDDAQPLPPSLALGAGGGIQGDGSQVEFISWSDSYLQAGRFSTPRMLEWLGERAKQAIDTEGYSVMRAIGDMTWALGDHPGVDELHGYEGSLNAFVGRYPQVLLCVYDLEQFSGEDVLPVLRNHPLVLIGGVPLESPYYVAPD